MCGSGCPTYPNFFPPTLNCFLQILKLEENSRISFRYSLLTSEFEEKIRITMTKKWKSTFISMHSVFGSKMIHSRLYLQNRPFYIKCDLFHFQAGLNIDYSKKKSKKKKVSYLHFPTLIFSGCNLNNTHFFIWPSELYHTIPT